MLEHVEVKKIVEAALLVADEPLGVDRLERLFTAAELDPDDPRAQLRAVLAELETDCATRGYELARVASGYRLQVPQDLSPWISRLWEQKPPRYTRALLETLALIAYQQPVTRGDIEEVRGVSVSTNIVRTLGERGWIREVGHREVPGRPALYATTKAFLDYFNLKSLSDLPPLADIRTLIEPIADELDLPPDEQSEQAEQSVDPADDLSMDESAEASIDVELHADPGSQTETGHSPDDDPAARPLATVVKLPMAE